MKTNKEVLSSILKTTQMGQIGIRAVMPYAIRQDLRNELQSQLREYDMIESEAHTIASARGWELKELDPATKAMAQFCARAMLTARNVDSKIAAMMINGNTRGVIKSLKNQHHAKNEDHAISALSKKLIDTENTNAQQMQGYV